MTMKFTTSRMANRMTPITTSPPIRNPPNACTTWPAAAGPSLPCERISRVVATLSDRRSSVVSSSRVGKLVKSSGRCRNIATIRTRTEAGERDGQAHVQQHGRQRHDQHRQQRHHAQRQPDVGAGEVGAQAVLEGGQGGGEGHCLVVPARTSLNRLSLRAACGAAIQVSIGLATVLAAPGLPRRCAPRNDGCGSTAQAVLGCPARFFHPASVGCIQVVPAILAVRPCSAASVVGWSAAPSATLRR